MSNRILVVTQQGEARFLTTETTPTRVITIQPTGARGETGPGVPTGGSTNDILKKTSSTNYDTAWETPTSAATANAVVRRDASGGAAFDDLTAAEVVCYGQILTNAANGAIWTTNVDSDIFTANPSSSVKSYNFAAYDTAGAALRDSEGTAYLTWGATAGNISITVDTISTGHFLSNPSTATAGHFLTKNGTAPTIAAGRSAWFSSSTGDPQFRNGTSSAVTLVYSGGALGTPSGGTLTNCTGLPVSTGISGLGTGVATFLATPSSANLLAALTTSTGTGSAVFATSPTITTPTFTRTGNGTIITASESSRTITMGTASYGVELVLTTATGTQGAYGTFSGMLEAFVAVNASSNTSGQRWMRFGNKSNRFAIQRLTDGGAGLTATPFSFANDAPESAFYMLTSGTVGFNTSTPSEKALLDLTSTTKGFLPPRMSTGQRDAITSVPAGLMVYNTSTNKLNFYNGSAWEAVTSA